MKTNESLAYSGATSQSLELFEGACKDLRCYVGDPLAQALKASQEAPAMPMAHVVLAWLNLLGTDPSGWEPANQAWQAGIMLSANAREAAHLQAIKHLLHGRWLAASLVLEDLNIQYPRDALALQVGHQIDFFTGNASMLRARIARAMPAWSDEMPGYHALLGMYAFGLEETGDYLNAERMARQALALEPRDGWAWHACAHVMEMQDRRREGIGLMREGLPLWSEGSFFSVHNTWHLALFHLGLDEIDEVLALIDQSILNNESALALDMLDASALLWRLHLRAFDVGSRWEALAQRWAALPRQSTYAFNDFHAMMAFVGAGRDADAQSLIDAQTKALTGNGDNVLFLREVGHSATLALRAFGEERYGDVVALLRPVRGRAHLFGGSHAQRHVIDLTLIEAARRDGQQLLAQALQIERQSPSSLGRPNPA